MQHIKCIIQLNYIVYVWYNFILIFIGPQLLKLSSTVNFFKKNYDFLPTKKILYLINLQQLKTYKPINNTLINTK